MARASSARTVPIATAGVLLAVIAVSAIGLNLTFVEGRAVRAAILGLQRQAAEGRMRSLAESVEADERAALDEILRAGDDPGALRDVRGRHPLIGEVFFLSGDGHVSLPLAGRLPRRSAHVSDELAPVEYDHALRTVWSQAPEEEKAEALADIHESEGIAPQWRLRALAALAALHARTGNTLESARRYEALFDEFAAVLPAAAQPSYLQLSLARSEALVAARRGPAASGVLRDALDRVRSGGVVATLDETAFFLDRARTTLGAVDAPGIAGPAREGLEALRDDLEAEAALQAERRITLRSIEALRDWLLARKQLEAPGAELGLTMRHIDRAALPDGDEPGGGHAEGARRPSGAALVAVWTRPPLSSARSSFAVAGFRACPGELESALTRRLQSEEGTPSEILSVRAERPGMEEGFLALASLPGDLGFLHIGIERGLWDATVARAQRPFRLAAGLLIALAIVVALGTLFLYRGVRREAALARLKTDFVANVSHELKTPLALIRLCGETLLLDRLSDPAKKRRYCEIIARESERLAHLISNILSFASIDAGRKRYDLRPCDLGKVVRDTYDSYRVHLDANGFAHSLSVDGNLPTTLADADAVSQAVINLMENAVKYSPDVKEARVDVRAEADAIRVSVRDRGIGISPEDRGRVWEDHFRTREARALGTRGSGLGLSLVRHIVAAHGGHVELESFPGKGSAFAMIFPVRGPASSMMEPRTEPKETDHGHEDQDPDRRG